MPVCAPTVPGIGERVAVDRATPGEVEGGALLDAELPTHLRWLAGNLGRPDFVPLTTADLTAIADVVEASTVPRDTVLYRQGVPADAMVMVEAGEIELATRRGDRRMVVARLGPGSLAGCSETLNAGTYHADAVAATETTLLRIRRERLGPLLMTHPAIGLRLLSAALEQLDDTYRRILRLEDRSLPHRLASLLADRAGTRGGLEMSHAEVARLLSVSRPALSNAVSTLRSAGIVSTGRRWIGVADWQALHAYVSAPNGAGAATTK